VTQAVKDTAATHEATHAASPVDGAREGTWVCIAGPETQLSHKTPPLGRPRQILS
jgi:hypothetical protein